MNRRTRLARLTVAAAICGVAALAGTAPPAQADYAGPMEFRSSAVVTRLTMSGGSGYLTIQPLMYSSGYMGFEVDIPAGDGVWSGPDDVPVPDMGIHCLRQSGPDLVYQCGVGPGGDPYDSPTLPPGGYQVTIPVHHTGTSAGLTGQAWLDGNVYVDVYRYAPDSFPVYDAPHAPSTAEVRSAQLTRDDPDTFRERGEAVVPVNLAVFPGETVTALDVALPETIWRLTGSNAQRLGLHCHRYPTRLHCTPASPTTTSPGLPTGRYTLVVDLHFENAGPEDDPSLTTSGVALTIGDSPSAVVDTFDWHYPVYYP